jgi:hypothetical protein
MMFVTYDYHMVLGAIAALLSVLGYGLYFRSIFRGETRPHLFSWFIYFLVDIIVFVAQVLNGAGPGAWVTLTGVIGTFCVAVVALRLGEKNITKTDWISFVAALGAIVFWQMTDNPLIAVAISAVINFLAIFPTIRKSYDNPFEESISIWIVDMVRFGLGITALVSLNLTTALFPSAVIAANIILVGIILIRRHILANKIGTI